MRLLLLVIVAALAGCANGPVPTGPAGQPIVSNVNPITGQRGGTSSGSSR